jgi:cytochrome oxidase Cu insertion factor (SCO1/SenC/PrrC family)
MIAFVKNLNSKRFLFTYLVVVCFLLLLWANRVQLRHPDDRVIPEAMQSYLVSPVLPVPEFQLIDYNKQVLTYYNIKNKWSFIYFSHSNCLPGCRTTLNAMKYIKTTLGDKWFNFFVFNIDQRQEADQLLKMLDENGYPFNAYSAQDFSIVEKLAGFFIALYLRTDYSNGDYLIEQEHTLFLVDPKGRFYARFKAPLNAVTLQEQVLAARQFYAKTE